MAAEDTPNFDRWLPETLARYAKEQYLQNQQLREANEQLRNDLKDAMRLARQTNMGDTK